jgi:hypothetical protein
VDKTHEHAIYNGAIIAVPQANIAIVRTSKVITKMKFLKVFFFELIVIEETYDEDKEVDTDAMHVISAR